MAALVGTAWVVVLLVLTAIYAGPLWRDEVNTLNVAQMPSLRELWNNMPFESFPPLWPLLVRGYNFLGLADGDAGIRMLGLYVGLFFLTSLWLTARWLGCRAPIISVALLGSLPSFIFIVGANRAYGLASGLLVLSFGMIWRMVELPSRSRIFLAGLTCFFFAHCVYYDVVFLGAMLVGGALVVLRRREWKTLGALIGIGAVSITSLVIYLPIIHRGSAYVPMMQVPFFKFSTLWDRFGDALALRSSGGSDSNGQEVWLWIWLILVGSVAPLVMQRASFCQAKNQEAVINRIQADRTLFCVMSILIGVFGGFAFLFWLRFLTQKWYYIEMLCLCVIALDGLLNANWLRLRPWGLLRVAFMVVMMIWGARSTWEEAQTRRSNVDRVAAFLNQRATERDVVVVQGAWEGITFNRYYHGRALWETVPPIDSHLVHRNDLVFARMHELNPMAEVLYKIDDTLKSGYNVWMVGNMSTIRPDSRPSDPPDKWFGTYANFWNAQVTAELLDHALQEQILNIPAGKPVFHLENLPLVRFAGYKNGATDRLVLSITNRSSP